MNIPPISRHLTKIFRHYKGGYYIKIHDATNENDENSIVYRCLKTNRIFTTTEKRWKELVPQPETSETISVERFTPVDTPELMNQQFEMYHRARCFEEKDRQDKKIAFGNDIAMGILLTVWGGTLIFIGYKSFS